MRARRRGSVYQTQASGGSKAAESKSRGRPQTVSGPIGEAPRNDLESDCSAHRETAAERIRQGGQLAGRLAWSGSPRGTWVSIPVGTGETPPNPRRQGESSASAREGEVVGVEQDEMVYAPGASVSGCAAFCDRMGSAPVLGVCWIWSNYPPAEPEALRLLAPQRGRIATDKVRTNNCTPRIWTRASHKRRNILPELANFTCLPGRAGETPISLDGVHPQGIPGAGAEFSHRSKDKQESKQSTCLRKTLKRSLQTTVSFVSVIRPRPAPRSRSLQHSPQNSRPKVILNGLRCRPYVPSRDNQRVESTPGYRKRKTLIVVSTTRAGGMANRSCGILFQGATSWTVQRA